jgi:hypothetical protein
MSNNSLAERALLRRVVENGLSSEAVAFVVQNDTRLDVFLRSNGVQQWRVPILAAKDGVVVTRGKGGQPVQLSGATTPLKAGDKVTVRSPLPTACTQALQSEADKNWRDYAIAPGTTSYDKRMAKFLGVRPNTILIDTAKNPSMADFQGFVRGIATSELITHPIRDLIIASHASGFDGHFRIALTGGAQDTVSYEDLEKAAIQKTILIDPAHLLPQPKDSGQTPHLRIYGCSAGRVEPFMKKLKEALGGNRILVTAPHHLVVGATYQGGIGRKRFEGEMAYAAYAFRVFLPSPPSSSNKRRPARTKKDIVNAFVAATAAEAAKAKTAKPNPTDPTSIPGRYMMQDRKWVTSAQWNAWVPDKPEDPRWFPSSAFAPLPVPDPHQIKNDVRLPVLRVKVNAPRRYECQLARRLFRNVQVMPLASDPGTEAGRRLAVKADLQRVPIYTAKHALPQYVRSGYDSIDEFMDGWNWQFIYDKKAKTLSYNPIRDEYSVIVPVTKAGLLMMNYYQRGAPPKRYEKLLPILNLMFRDPVYFKTY